MKATLPISKSSKKQNAFYPAKNKFNSGLFAFQLQFGKSQRFFSSKTKGYPIPKLQLIDDMVEVASNHKLPNLSNTAFIGVQHMLETTVTLFDGLIKLGVKAQNMYFTGKCYSSAPAIEAEVQRRKIHLIPAGIPEKPGQYHEYARDNLRKMWKFFVDDIKRKKIERLIILDEGGRCLETMPENITFEYAIASIEQTRAGLYSKVINQRLFPLIDVASSAAKKYLESKLIATAVLDKVNKALAKLNLPDDTVCGIVGNGAIGYALAEYLLAKGYKVVVYDQSEAAFRGLFNKNFYRVESIKQVIVNAQYIFSCTGKDISQELDILNLASSDKIFISCSSEDKEFLSLLRQLSQESRYADPLSTIAYRSNLGGKILILNGGFPINFDRTPSSVPAHKIELTRGLLLGACLQAIISASKPIGDGITLNRHTHQTLNPYIQNFIVEKWIKRNHDITNSKELAECFKNVDWIKKNSGGEYYDNDFLKQIFTDTYGEDKIHTKILQP